MNSYEDANALNALTAVKTQLARYFTACYNDKASLKAVEKAIASKLLSKIEDILVQDVVDGGEHDIEYLNHPITGNSVLFTASFVFCGYEEATENLLLAYGVPIEGNFNRVEEGRKVLAIIDDLHLLSVKDFAEKHYKDYEHKNLDKLLKFLYNNYNDNSFKPWSYTLEGIYGGVRYKNIEPVLAQFFNANKQAYRGRYKSGKLYFHNNEVKDILVMFSARNQQGEKVKDHFSTGDLEIRLYYGEDGYTEIKLKDVSEKWRDKLGKKIEQESFLYRLEELKKENLKGRIYER